MSVQGHVREEARRKMDGRKRGLKGGGKGDWKNGARDGDRARGIGMEGRMEENE